MIGDLLSIPGALCSRVIALLINGFARGAALAVIAKLLPQDDPRRAELYAIPRWERPL